MRCRASSATVGLVLKVPFTPPRSSGNATVPLARAERRSAIRASMDSPVRLRGRRRPRHVHGLEAIVVSISASGLYMFVTVRMCPGERLFTVVPLRSGASAAVRGYITRVELCGAQHFGVAMRFTRTRLLPAVSHGVRLGL